MPVPEELMMKGPTLLNVMTTCGWITPGPAVGPLPPGWVFNAALLTQPAVEVRAYDIGIGSPAAVTPRSAAEKSMSGCVNTLCVFWVTIFDLPFELVT